MHRTWAYNEVSARYSELPEEYYIPDVTSIGVQSKDNKQVRTLLDVLSEDENVIAEDIQTHINDACYHAFAIYKLLLEKGCPRELARGVLPMNTYTHFFGTVDLHNLFHFLKLRLHPHAQWEIQQYAKALLELITPIVPVAVAAFKEFQLG